MSDRIYKAFNTPELYRTGFDNLWIVLFWLGVSAAVAIVGVVVIWIICLLQDRRKLAMYRKQHAENVRKGLV